MCIRDRVQFLVFLVVSILFLAATRPWARKYVNAKMQRTNADSLIGENIRISERVSNMDQTGMAVVPVSYTHLRIFAESTENVGRNRRRCSQQLRVRSGHGGS